MSHDLPPLIQDLLESSRYPHRPESIRLVQTHASFVMIAEPFVYKIKKAVNFGFLDYSSPARRRHFCHEEIRLNRRTSKGVYLAVVDISETPGGFFPENQTHPVEAAVKMRYLPENATLQSMILDGRADDGIVRLIARHIARFHRFAQTDPDISRYGDLSVIRHHSLENFEQVRPFIGGPTLQTDRFERLREWTVSRLESSAKLFDARVAAGRIRDGHGDLRPQHVYVRGETIDIVDGIEFNPAYRFGDVASDLAFLLMEIDRLGHNDLSGILLNEYLAQTGDFGLIGVLDFYRTYRSMVRAKVSLLTSAEPEVPGPDQLKALSDAGTYFLLSERYAGGRPAPSLFITCGLSGSGKTTRARRLAARIGAVVIPSDTMRKTLAGLSPDRRATGPFGQGIYSEDMSRRTYEALFETAEDLLREGWTVILDATFPARRHRDAARGIASKLGLPFKILLCEAPDGELKVRMLERNRDTGEPSDATPDILSEQRKQFEALDAEERSFVDENRSGSIQH